MCSKKKYLLMAAAGVSLLGLAAVISLAAKKKCCCKCSECCECDDEPEEQAEGSSEAEAAEDVAESPEAEEAPVAETFVLNSARKVAHKENCRYARSDAERLTYTGDPEELISQGYRPCGTCKPW